MPLPKPTLTLLLSLSTLLTLPTPTTATALSPPSHPLLPPHALPRSISISTPDLSEKCTFTLYHRRQSQPPNRNQNQASPPPPTTTTSYQEYIHLPTLTDNPNTLTIDVTALRPRAAHNSYTRVSSTRRFVVDGLLGGRKLSINAVEGGELRFEVAGVVWGSDDVAAGGGEKEKEAWCLAGGWNEGGRGLSMERKMECAFPCGRIRDEEVEDEEERLELR
ncbi:hypothetical protein T440DRAFT_455134 [Plenodomus tracheiphilus IPT5]|uniref:Uncharacterized protein n=1 Tax=Plenodomus tracheiphilus IPT5 TaxID=1408161 RepID=A0A6A7B1E7_9PLEO|nr:hypothetical protein T440DRAFT_455134 [Plenodomus tracheiphilus IPT5]